MQLGDPVDALLDAREHPEPEQVDLQEARVGAGVLVPLAELAAGHRRRLNGNELDERPRRDHHPARVLRDVPRQPGDLAGEELERTPALREELPLCVGELPHLLGDAVRVPPVGHAGEPLELGVRKPERLADVANRSPRAVRREARDECCVLVAVALGDADDELLADVAREVEVDVGHRGELPVDEAAEREVVLDRIDVREPGQVADDRADRAPPPPPRWEEHPRRVAAPHLERTVARELEHLVVEQEEPRQPEPPDQRELALQACVRLRSQRRGTRAVALAERLVADRGQLTDRGVGAVREVRIAIAELLGEVECEARCELARPLGCRTVDPGEALHHLRRGAEHGLAVPAPLALAPVERRAAADRDERVLEQRPSRRVRVDVSRRDRLDPEVLGEIAKRDVAPRVSPLVRSLELDVEALAAECVGETRRAARIMERQPVARAAGEADEALVQLRDGLERCRGR